MAPNTFIAPCSGGKIRMNRMRIAAPLSRVQDVGPLAQAGADEFYCGVFTRGWRQFDGVFGNTRPWPQANLRGFSELAAALKAAKGCHRELYLCVNNPCAESWFPVMRADIARAAKMGVSGFIVSDPILIPYIRGLGRGFKIIVSTMAGSFNAKALDFFADLGADRIVLDRQLTLKEIVRLAPQARAIPVDLEVFVLNITCLYVNAFCALHYDHQRFDLPLAPRPALPPGRPPSACRQRRVLKIYDHLGDRLIRRSAPVDWSEIERRDLYCAACSLGALRKCGVSHVKIIGRGFDSERVLADIRFIRAVLDLTERMNGRLTITGTITAARRLRRRIYGEDCHATQCWHGGILRRRGS